MNVTLIKSPSIEEVSYSFSINEITRKLFEELELSKIGLLSIKSSEDLLKSLKKEYAFSSMDTLRASKYLINTDEISVKALEKLRVLLQAQNENNLEGHSLPETFKTSFTWTIDAKSLQNFINLKDEESTLLEMKNLATRIFNSLPDDQI